MKFWVNWRWLYIELALPQWIHIDPKMSPVVRPEKSEKIPSEPAGYLGIWWFTRGFSWFFHGFPPFFSDKRYIYIYHMIIRFEIRCCYIFSPIFPYGFHMFPTFSYVSHVFSHVPNSQQFDPRGLTRRDLRFSTSASTSSKIFAMDSSVGPTDLRQYI